MHQNAKFDWSGKALEALRAIDLRDIAEAIGFRSTSGPSDTGWLEGHAIGRDDESPSAALNVSGEDKLLGRYTDLGGPNGAQRSMSFFEFLVLLGAFATWQEARDYCFNLAGVELPGTAHKPSTNGKHEPADDKVTWRPWDESTAKSFCERYKPGVTPEALQRAGARICLWRAKSTTPFLCIAIPTYLAADEPAGWVLYRADGEDFPGTNSKTKIKRRKIHNVKGTKESWIHASGRDATNSASVIWVVEGVSDALAFASIVPAGHAVVTNSAGAGSQLAGVPFDMFRGKTVYVVGDADKAGVNGSAKHAQIIADAENSAKVYLLKLPYPVEESHGKDLRNWINEGYDASDIQDLIATGELIKSEARTVERSNTTDVSNAERLVQRHGKYLRYCHPWGKWLVWDGRRWNDDQTAEVDRRAKETARLIYTEAANIEDSRERQSLANWAKQSETKSRIDATIALARSEPGIPVVPDNLDRDPWSFNCTNGTVDLQAGKLRPHRQEDYITKLASVEYDPDAKCPVWMAYLDKTFAGNQNLIEFMQRAAGYSLTGITSERCMFVLHGGGKNGKSTFLETLSDIIGMEGYALRTPTETLMIKKGQNSHGIPNDIARLKGARFVWASESEEGQRLSEASIKDMTGGRDTLAARFMRGEWFNFRPEFKIWLGTNHRPDIRGTDNAIWDRIRLIPFDVRLSEQEQDKKLPDKLAAEASGILAWMVRGCLEWQRIGLGEPAEVKEATDAYREEQDLIGGWVEDCCLIDQHAKAASSSLYKSYSRWCEENGIASISQKRLTQKLLDRGLRKERETAGPMRNKWIIYGIVNTEPSLPGSDSDEPQDDTGNEDSSDKF